MEGGQTGQAPSLHTEDYCSLPDSPDVGAVEAFLGGGSSGGPGVLGGTEAGQTGRLEQHVPGSTGGAAQCTHQGLEQLGVEDGRGFSNANIREF